MATACTTPTCPTDCDDALPAVEFSICAPETHFGEISNIYLTAVGNPLTDETSAVEWATRMAAVDATKILSLTVIGDKPAPEESEVVISNDRIVVGQKGHTLNIKIDETNATNYTFLRSMECGRKVKLWFKTAGGMLYGGNVGIDGTLRLNEIIPESRKELVVFAGTFKWNAKTAPCRTVSVI